VRNDAATQSSRSVRSGFTLFEVAISLLIMAIGVLAAVALLPRSLEQLNMARQKIYVSAIAMDLSSHFTYGYVRNNKTRGDYYHLSKVANSPDIERATNGYLSSLVDYRNMAPVPPEILLRLDSDDDTIRNLVRDGIPVYYVLPRQMDVSRPVGVPSPDGKALSNEQMADTLFESQGAELGQVIFAVVGDPQLNADWAMMHYTMVRDPTEIGETGPGLGRGWPWFFGGGYGSNTINGVAKYPSGGTPVTRIRSWYPDEKISSWPV
jgi:prepilin-type N-terminal cleavage/methylation domain-containing protein